MWQNFCSQYINLQMLFDCVALFITGLVIKITDDFVDLKEDSEAFAGKTGNLLNKLGRGVLPYAIMFFSVALYMNLKLSLSLYLAAYVVGMFKQTDCIFPSGLKGYQEIILISLVGIGLFGFRVYFLAIALLVMVQLIDDLVDFKKDTKVGTNNLYCALGRVEGFLVLTLIVIINMFFQPFYTMITVIAMTVIERVSTLEWKGREKSL